MIDMWETILPWIISVLVVTSVAVGVHFMWIVHRDYKKFISLLETMDETVRDARKKEDKINEKL